MEGDTVCPDESDKEWSDGTLGEPLGDWVEQELRTSVGVLLPSIKLSISIALHVQEYGLPRHQRSRKHLPGNHHSSTKPTSNSNLSFAVEELDRNPQKRAIQTNTFEYHHLHQ